MKEICEKINCYKEEIINDVCELVKIPSVESNPSEGLPFGKNVNNALEFVLKLSNDLGFSTKNIDNYVGYCEYGKGDELIGILTHIDVVEASEGWNYDPFEPQIHDGKIYGRGTIDDKGPLIACLYALYLLKESDITFNKRVRIIFGTNEETGWEGIKHYIKNEEIPSYSFTPDANFPVIHGEKGILGFYLEKEFESKNKFVKSINGGTAANVVPSKCEAILYYNEGLIEKMQSIIQNYTNINYSLVDGEIKLVSIGRSSHASQPELGENAISNLINFLGNIIEPEDQFGKFLEHYTNDIGSNYHGEQIFGSVHDEISGRLTFNIGQMKFDGRKLKISVDIRYPITYNYETLYDLITKFSVKLGCEYIEFEHFKPIYVDENSLLIETLMSVYKAHTNDINSKPLVIGGGTYARAFENCVAFGPVLPNEKELAHGPNEFIEIDRLLELVEIYNNAIRKLLDL